MEIIDSNCLVAFQGPQAVNVLQRFTKYDLSSLGFFYMDDMEIEGKCFSKPTCRCTLPKPKLTSRKDLVRPQHSKFL